MQNRLFTSLPAESFAEVLRFFNLTRRFPPYELMIQAGAADDKLILLEEGAALIKGGGREVARLEAGDVLGEVGFVASGKRCASVFAGPDGALARLISPERFAEFAAAHPELAVAVLQNLTFLLASKLQRTNQAMRQAMGEIENLRHERSAQEEQRTTSLFGRIFGSLGSP